MVVTLEEAKLYLRIDSDDENALITKFILIAEELCEEILRYKLSELKTIPEAIKISILYAVANMYEHRETFDVKLVVETMVRLLFSYRKESW